MKEKRYQKKQNENTETTRRRIASDPATFSRYSRPVGTGSLEPCGASQVYFTSWHCRPLFRRRIHIQMYVTCARLVLRAVSNVYRG